MNLIENNKMNEIMNRIKHARIEADFTFQDLADKTGMSKSTLQRYETGYIRNMPIDKLELIANALHIDPGYLMGWEDDSDNNIEDNSYYINEDARDIANFMFRNPEYKVLFDATRKVKKEDIEFVKQMIDRMGSGNDDTGC